MAGVYTENQPDFTWLMPYEEKQFVQYFMPYRELGVVKEASKDLIFNINEVGDGKVEFKVFATSKQDVCIILRNDNGEVYYKKEITLSPEHVLTETVDVKGARFNQLTFDIVKTFVYGQRTVLSWHAEADEIRPIPDSAEAALLPSRHATWSPVDYYEEALRRDPDDIRCLNALGLWYIRKGRFQQAEAYLCKAVKLLQKRNPNPYDGEPIYNLGLALKYQGKTAEAYERFWKATWNKAWADAGYFEAAKISVLQGRYEDALDELDRCLISNWHNHKARALKTAVMRKLDKKEEALALIDESLRFDQFNYGCRYEQYLLTGEQAALDELKQLMRHSSDNYDEIALDYCAAGLNDEARALWQIAIGEHATSPMTYYYLGRYDEAEQADSAYCFPNRPEAVIALEAAKQQNPTGSKAPYYLGCLYYAANSTPHSPPYGATSPWPVSTSRTVSRRLSNIWSGRSTSTRTTSASLWSSTSCTSGCTIRMRSGWLSSSSILISSSAATTLCSKKSHCSTRRAAMPRPCRNSTPTPSTHGREAKARCPHSISCRALR